MGARHRCGDRQESGETYQLRSAAFAERDARLRKRGRRGADEHVERRAKAGRAEPVPAAIHGRGTAGAPGVLRGSATAEVGPAYSAVQPPSTTSDEPVISAAASLARKTIAPVKSSS